MVSAGGQALACLALERLPLCRFGWQQGAASSTAAHRSTAAQCARAASTAACLAACSLLLGDGPCPLLYTASAPAPAPSPGREDIDVRMLGQGRPFILEVHNARRRVPPPAKLAALEARVAQVGCAGSGPADWVPATLLAGQGRVGALCFLSLTAHWMRCSSVHLCASHSPPAWCPPLPWRAGQRGRRGAARPARCHRWPAGAAEGGGAREAEELRGGEPAL